MNQASEDFRDKLLTAGLVTASASSAWFGRIGDLPEKPLDCVAFKSGGGSGPLDVMDTSITPIENDSVQVFVRGRGQVASWDKAQAIADAVNAWGKFTQGGSKYEETRQRGGIPEFSHSKENNTWTWVINFGVYRKAL